jgi:cyclopropane-fatty-acyl-phospholipid synthase
MSQTAVASRLEVVSTGSTDEPFDAVGSLEMGEHVGERDYPTCCGAPDRHMRPAGETVAYLEHGGLEVRDVHALREHYVRTVSVWPYLVGGSMAFREGRMGVDPILMVRPDGPHTLPWRRSR